MNRKIDVIHTSSQEQITVTTTARTWGDLKNSNSGISRMASGMKAVVKETKVTLESDDAVLPDHDIVVYLTAGKVKAGQASETIKARVKAIIADARTIIHNSLK
jgi:hypothetical protein